MWRHMQGVVRLLITTLLQIYYSIFQRKHFENPLRFERIMAMRLLPRFYGPQFIQYMLCCCYLSQRIAVTDQ